MTWRDCIILASCSVVSAIFGMIVGLSLGFHLGTKRTVILFLKYFPSNQTMLQLVKTLFAISNRLNDAKPDGTNTGKS